MYGIGQICFGGYLFLLSIWDIRKRSLPLWMIGAGGVMAVIFQDVKGSSIMLHMAGAAVGAAFLVISRMTGEALGYGDSLLILILGGYLGFWNVLYLLLIAYLLAAVFAGAALIRRRFSRNTAFPFVPFLTAAYIGIAVSGGI